MPVYTNGRDALDFAAALGRAEGRAGQAPLALVNRRTDKVIADAVELAVTRETRRKGLLGRDELRWSTGMVLAPCFSIHTAFMRFPIDAAFVNRDGTIVKMVHELRAWRMASALLAHAVIELPAGTLRGRDVATGDRLCLVPRDGDGHSAAHDVGGGS